ncbi:Zinc finger protein 827, partial [Galemys pyrenaicus]
PPSLESRPASPCLGWGPAVCFPLDSLNCPLTMGITATRSPRPRPPSASHFDQMLETLQKTTVSPDAQSMPVGGWNAALWTQGHLEASIGPLEETSQLCQDRRGLGLLGRAGCAPRLVGGREARLGAGCLRLACCSLGSNLLFFLPPDVSRQDEAEGDLSEGEHWYENSSETPSEASYGEVQENYKLSLEDRVQEQSTSPDTSLGSATPSSHTLELVALDGEVLRDALPAQDHLSPGVSSLCDEDPPGSTKPLSSNLRRLLEAGSLKLEATATANGRVESPVSVGSNLSFSPPSHHAQQLSVLARKLAEKQEQNDQYTPSNRFLWNQGKWLPNSTTTCGLSPDSAILKLKAAANAVLQDKSLARTEDTMRFESFSSPFSSQSASSTLAALSKKVSERSLTPGQEHPPPASSFLSLASMTSSAALLKEVAARAAGSLLAEKSSLVPEDPLPPPPSEKKPEKVTPPPPPPPPPPAPQSLELLLLPVPKGRVSKPSNAASEEESGKPFQCPICGLVIKRKSYWKRHMVIHTGLKSHQCPLCPFRCARKDNLKSHMKVHQHQDRGETFQCQLCPFTSSRHFSLKLHMRCHQHFLRTEAKVKEEIPDPDVKGSPHLSDSACLGQQREGGGTELVGTMMTSNTPERTSQGGAGVSPLLVKEEPKEDNGLPTSFTLNAADRPANHTKLKDPSEYVANSASALFSQDISVKMASDFLMKLSVKEEPKEEEVLAAPLPRPSYVFSPEAEAPAPSVSEDTLKSQDGKGTALRRDMSVKAASELLIKLSAHRLLPAWVTALPATAMSCHGGFGSDGVTQPTSAGLRVPAVYLSCAV